GLGRQIAELVGRRRGLLRPEDLRTQRLARAIGVRIVGHRDRRGLLGLGGSGRLVGRRLLPAEARRQIVVRPEVPQVDHVVALRRGLGGVGLQRRERGLGLGIELLAFERAGGPTGLDLVLRRVVLPFVSAVAAAVLAAVSATLSGQQGPILVAVIL